MVSRKIKGFEKLKGLLNNVKEQVYMLSNVCNYIRKLIWLHLRLCLCIIYIVVTSWTATEAAPPTVHLHQAKVPQKFFLLLFVLLLFRLLLASAPLVAKPMPSAAVRATRIVVRPHPISASVARHDGCLASQKLRAKC